MTCTSDQQKRTSEAELAGEAKSKAAKNMAANAAFKGTHFSILHYIMNYTEEFPSYVL